jgi:hypothetical protein
MATKRATPNLFESIAKASYEATRAWTEPSGGTKRARWEDAPQWRRTSALEGVRRAVAGGTPEQLHESWRKDRLNRGWRYGAVRDAKKKEDPHLLAYAELSDAKKRKADLFAAVATTLFKCGKERWDVKTLTDPAAGKVNIDEPQEGTIAALTAEEAPVEPVERQPAELVTYKLTGTITMAKLEADKDLHMVLGDQNGTTMIIEAVSPDCAENSRVLEEITAVRQAVEAKFPGAAAGDREDGLTVTVTVTGVAFFDRLHNQEGVAKNGIELHPVLSFEVHP